MGAGGVCGSWGVVGLVLVDAFIKIGRTVDEAIGFYLSFETLVCWEDRIPEGEGDDETDEEPEESVDSSLVLFEK